MSSLVLPMLPLLFSWISCLYMPMALLLYLYHSSHSCIRYRRPDRTAFPALCVMLCAHSMPILIFVNAHCLLYVIWFVLALCSMVSYLLLQLSLVVTFKITELLAEPTRATAATALRMIRFRWFLHPRIQSSIWLAANILFAAPVFYPYDINALLITVEGSCFGPVAWNVVLSEFAIIGLVSIVLAVQVSQVVDNFGLRGSFLSTAKGGVLCILFQLVLSAGWYLDNWTWLATYHVVGVTACVPPHVFFYYNILAPLRQALFPSPFRQRIVVLSASIHMHPHLYPQHLSLFHDFLRHPDGFRAFLEFSRTELTVERLLAWQAIVQYQDAPSFRRANAVFDECLATHCIYATSVGTNWRPFYQMQRPMWHPATPAAPALFDRVLRDLEGLMHQDQLGRFLAHPSGCLAWHDFLDRRRTLEKLDQVMTIVSKQSLPRAMKQY
ncbi:Aste57867_9956 [Aphanomyces stellatus]|uniref:Aste57867_9956 protein n=1 Tax=Aphanomyces stellatus TaxID=120398 RepID=A0A485KP59_9STRA|nr:hypothetical protein As57867_009917 [Aphanomyces stellatus]VFT86834.1 Aste57867_9956 [Aphanomyces stellatus]